MVSAPRDDVPSDDVPSDGGLADDGVPADRAATNGTARFAGVDDGAPAPWVAADDGVPADRAVKDGAALSAAVDGPSSVPSADRARTVPPREELDRIAVDVHVRRRPRYGAFIVLGMIVAGAAALVWATQVPREAHANWDATVWVTTLGAMAFGALIGAGVAVFADWRSGRQR